MKPYRVLVERLWALYAWPEGNLPMRGVTASKILTYKVQPEYVSDEARTIKRPSRAWDYGRVRYFYERVLAGEPLDPIEIDNFCDGGRVYPEPVVNDGHHRLAGAYLARARFILADYGGRVDLRRYLTGHRATCPSL